MVEGWGERGLLAQSPRPVQVAERGIERAETRKPGKNEEGEQREPRNGPSEKPEEDEEGGC
jgi:hypothetical protein